MAIDRERARQYLKAFDFARLFTQELGWDKYSATIAKQIDGHDYHFKAVAEKHGVVVLVSDSIPVYAARVKVDKLVAKEHFEHLIVFADQARGRQVWQWVRKEPGKPTAVRTYHYASGQSGELLIQKLENLAFTLEEEEGLTLGEVTGRLRTLDVEKVTKKFYERFKTEHSSFLSFIKGIPDKQMESWYASVMVNRLMFLYFIQEKGFLNEDRDYLRNKLKESRGRKPDAYYKDFLCPLFFQGFARKKAERSAPVNRLLGEIPYLNGGLFQPHQIEELHGKQIVIADKAFERLFNFFKEYDWHLDERENRNDREINPDVLGYIFEKYINQKQMGAYYTKEDITEYIAQNTIIPFLLDEARKGCAVAFAAEGSVWRLLRDDPDRYIHDAMKWGANLALPSEIKAGVGDVKKRTGWNRTAPEEFALPTELWREAIDRHQRYRSLKAKLAAGEVHEVNDLVTMNLNIRQFAQDVIQFSEGPELLRAIWKVIERVSVLDPTCGSGAFLFAALNILKPLYEACLIRMQGFIEDMESAGPHHPTKFSDFKQTLDESKRHPKQDYFILKAIIVNNLFGVDIMEEAVEICKLRLFLKLVAQVESQDRIEPLPDIDFNIRSGNTLIGYARYDDVKLAVGSKLDFGDAMSRIEDKAKTLDAAVQVFRGQQTQLNGTVTQDDKVTLRNRYFELESELNDYLSGEYGIKPVGIRKWTDSHKPFHWFCDFHAVMGAGGFDVVLGNPPYVEKKEITGQYSLRGLSTDTTNNLFAYSSERGLHLLREGGRFGFIIPLSSMSTEKFLPLQQIVLRQREVWLSHFDDRPSKLFDGLEHIQLTIVLARHSMERQGQAKVFVTRCMKWSSTERALLFKQLNFIHPPPTGLQASVPKVGSTEEHEILAKIWSHDSTLGAGADGGAHRIFYTRKVHAFLNILDFVPEVRDSRGVARDPSEQKTLNFDSKLRRDAALALLNSTLFRWFLSAFSDCRNLNRREVLNFPVDLGGLTSAKGQALSVLTRELMKSLKRTSEYREMKFKDQTLQVQCIMPRHSKSIIDQIDEVIASYFGFSDQARDFILNYDIKYRLGADADDD